MNNPLALFPICLIFICVNLYLKLSLPYYIAQYAHPAGPVPVIVQSGTNPPGLRVVRVSVCFHRQLHVFPCIPDYRVENKGKKHKYIITRFYHSKI